MTREEIIRNLEYTMEKHKNDIVDTFGTDISLMCKDILDYLKQESHEDCISMSVIKDIKAEIEDLPSELTEDGRRMIRRWCVFRIINKYTTKSKDKE